MNRRLVLLTGAAGDIGTAILKRLRMIGLEVIGIDSEDPKEPDQYFDFLKTDLRDRGQVSERCVEIGKRHSPLWAFVHCAGVYPIVSFEAHSDQLLDEVLNVNLSSAFQIAHDL